MARYTAAMKVLEYVFGLNPENSAASSLQKRVAFQLSALQRKENIADEPAEPSGFGHRRRGVIMIVDQDERVLIRLSETLRRYGLETVSAFNYREALDTLSIVTPDLVVSEINFENGSVGFDLFLWLRSGTATQWIPFVFLATRVDREVLIAGKRLGVDDFLLKPMDAGVVAASILNCLARVRKNHTPK